MSQSKRAVPLAYFLSFTCYGSWLRGRTPGSVDEDHNQYGTPFLPPDPVEEAHMPARIRNRLISWINRVVGSSWQLSGRFLGTAAGNSSPPMSAPTTSI